MTIPYRLHVGIDIAARSASVAWLRSGEKRSRPFSIPQTPDGMTDLRERLLALEPSPQQVKIVMEATAGYWINLAIFLHKQGFAVSIINPIQAHHFAEALLKRAKNDALDAQSLALLSEKLDTRLWTPPPPIYEELYQRLKQRENLVDMRSRSINRMKTLGYRPHPVDEVKDRLTSLSTLVVTQIACIDKELVVILRQDPEWYATFQRLRDIPGIGLVTAAWLMVSTINFSLCSTPEQLVSYLGLAPHVQQSGTSLSSYRRIGGAGSNKRVRKLFYMATLSAIKLNPVIRAHFQSLTGRGKNGKVACIACSRKLLHIVWAVATKGVPFDPNYPATSTGKERLS